MRLGLQVHGLSLRRPLHVVVVRLHSRRSRIALGMSRLCRRHHGGGRDLLDLVEAGEEREEDAGQKTSSRWLEPEPEPEPELALETEPEPEPEGLSWVMVLCPCRCRLARPLT